MSPPSRTALPPRVNAPAVTANVIPLNCVLAAKLLLVDAFVFPSKASMSIAPGSVFQLPAVIQLLSEPPPDQVSVAADAPRAEKRAMLVTTANRRASHPKPRKVRRSGLAE